MPSIPNSLDFTLQDVIDVLPFNTEDSLDAAFSDAFQYDENGSKFHPQYKKVYEDGVWKTLDRLSNWRAYGDTARFADVKDTVETETGYPVIFMDTTDNEDPTVLVTIEKEDDYTHYLSMYGVDNSGNFYDVMSSPQTIAGEVTGLEVVNSNTILVLAKDEDDTNSWLLSFRKDGTTFSLNNSIQYTHTSNSATPKLVYSTSNDYAYVCNVDNTDSTNSLRAHSVNTTTGVVASGTAYNIPQGLFNAMFVRRGITSGAAVTCDTYTPTFGIGTMVIGTTFTIA